MAFFCSTARDLAIAQIPKAGIQTIREWLPREFAVVTNDETMRVSRRVAFIRDPLDRLESCYSFMYWLADRGTPHRCGAPVDSWQSFVNHILAHDDEHWRPQSLHVGTVPNIYRRFENLADCYGEFQPGLLPHNNRATRLPVDDYRRDELLHLYREDLALWLSA